MRACIAGNNNFKQRERSTLHAAGAVNRSSLGEAFNPPESDAVRDARATDAAAKISQRFIHQSPIVFDREREYSRKSKLSSASDEHPNQLLRELNEQSVSAVAWDRLALKRRRSRRISMRAAATTTDRKRPFASSMPIRFCELKFWSSGGHRR